jgi:hypothetical protein
MRGFSLSGQEVEADRVHSMVGRVFGERSIGGLRTFLMRQVLPPCLGPEASAVDFGAGTGALAARLKQAGCQDIHLKRVLEQFHADLTQVPIDLNEVDFSIRLGEGQVLLVISVEVIERVESMVGFLRNVTHLVDARSVAVITTPNIENSPVRPRFVLNRTIRMTDPAGHLTGINPIFAHLLQHHCILLSGLSMKAHFCYPADGYLMTRRRYPWAMCLVSSFGRGDALIRDNHVLILTWSDQ